MNLEPEDIARLLVALMLLLVWSVRRVERANLIWGLAYLLVSAGHASAGAADNLVAARIFQIAGAGLGAALLWLGVGRFLHRRMRLGLVALTGAIWLILLWVAARFAPPMWTALLQLPLLLATLYAAQSVDTFGSAYRITAVLTAVPALLLFLTEAQAPQSVLLHWLTAFSYALLALAIAHVTVGRFQNQLQSLIHTDGLTGLSNRTGFVAGIKRLTSATDHDPIHLAVLCMDVENFREINEAFGTRSSNQLLCEVGRRLRQAADRVYLIARDESDRFLVLMSGTSAASAARSAEETAAQIRSAMAKPVALSNNSVALRVRIGSDIAFGQDTDIETLIQHATVASGRNRASLEAGLSFYNAAMNQRALRKLDLEHGLRNALSKASIEPSVNPTANATTNVSANVTANLTTRGELWIAYQPIVDVDSGCVLALEALLRWQSPLLGAVAPAEIIPVAEECDLIFDIGDWVLKETAAQLAMWTSQGKAVPVSVNVSARQLAQPQFAGRVLEILDGAGVAAGLLDIELTESVLLGDDLAVMENLAILHAAGVGLALDDFGTGFSSLSYLTRLPLKTLKIDKAFVHQLHRDQRSRRLTETICAIGHQLDLALTAEGIETGEQSAMLRSFGVTQMQGFYFAEPRPASEVTLGVVLPRCDPTA